MAQLVATIMFIIGVCLVIYSKGQQTLAERMLFEESASARNKGFDAVKKLESRVHWANARAKLTYILGFLLGLIAAFIFMLSGMGKNK